MPLQKVPDLEYCSHNRLGAVPRWHIDKVGCIVHNAFHSRSLETDNTQYNEQLFYEVWFLD
jgi:hypothetical protein